VASDHRKGDPPGVWNDISTVGLTQGDDGDAPPGGYTLHVIHGDVSARHRLPTSGSFAIGRGEGAEIHVPIASISRRHAILHLGDEPTIEDLRSANGTKVGGRTIAPGERVPLPLGEVVELGELVMILFANGRAPEAPLTDEAVPVTTGEIVADPAMVRLRRVIERIAPSGVNVLFLGETGAGKEVLATALHRASKRAQGPFVRINCAAVNDALFESELFGHERGAFTGAVQAKPGLFETASGGTLFLDEIGELSLPLQAKLLRAIEEKKVMRVGALEPRAIDIRIVSATNRDLEQEVAAHRFREDLYFRLNGIPLSIPPLRERPTEILLLAREFLAQAAKDAGRAPPSLPPETVEILQRYPWPGNIRELRNVITRAVLLATDEVTPQSLALPERSKKDPPAPGSDLGAELQAVEKKRILDVLERCGGNQSRAARELGISRNTLLTRLRAYGLRS
jgi:transcriptional regulator with PAS, ATPase and Fis domain